MRGIVALVPLTLLILLLAALLLVHVVIFLVEWPTNKLLMFALRDARRLIDWAKG